MKKSKSRPAKKRSPSSSILPNAVRRSFPIVGVGASSGGLDAFTQLLGELPCDTGMAFVLIQHLDPTHVSLLTETLAKKTKMPVREIKDGMKTRPNEVYVLPPGLDVGILRGTLTAFPRDKTSRNPNMAIDFFFQSLAIDCGSQAIGVVLSGTANDGTEGLRAIKAENGVTFVQDPKTAKYSGMPQSAVNAEVVDFCLGLPMLAAELVRLARHPYLWEKMSEPLSSPSDVQNLQKIFVLLSASAGVDYSEYKTPTIRRRIARRMALLKMENTAKYIKLLQTSRDEAKALAADVLIHVTSFFRDPDVYNKLQTMVFPELMKHKAPGTPIRIWVTGCSSGEETYSVAISLLEFLGEDAGKYPIQMFSSDVSERMIEKARTGFYPESSLRNMDHVRIRRFFVKVEGGYQISKMVRDLCVFVRHDLARDPPFSKLDLVTCRNVLIYFEPQLQKRIITTFHYCLNQPGFLLLGRSENISSHHHFFSTTDKANKIFSRIAITSQLRFSTLQNRPSRKSSPTSNHPLRVAGVAGVAGVPTTTLDLSKQIDHHLLSEYAPAGILINEHMEVIQYRGKTSAYLENPPGQPQHNALKLIRDGLFAALKSATDEAKKKKKRVRRNGITFKLNGVKQMCNLIVAPISKLSESGESLLLVLFENVPIPMLRGRKGAPLSKSSKLIEDSALQKVAKLEAELRVTQDYLQAVNDEHQKANDTLNSVNEEFVSGNEELQSMNEELETAKEELQSTNEELTTVNDELQNRNHETAEINDDLINLLNGAEIPILILDLNRRIRRFTPKARSIMNLLPTDLGRQIDDIKPNINIKNLDQQIRDVIETVTTKESEVQDREGAWHRIQIRPYKTSDNKIAGAVLSLVNIDTLRRSVIDAEWLRDYSESIVEAVQIPLLVLNEKMNIISANWAFYDAFKFTKKQTEGKNLYSLDACQWDIPSLKKSLGEMIAKRMSFINVEITCDLHNGTRVLSLSARPIQFHDGARTILLSMEDITERKNRENDRRDLLHQAQEAKGDAEKANLTKDLFLATLSHELRTPLTSLILQAQMLQRGTLSESKVKHASKSIERAARTQTQLIEDLLDVSRIVTGKLKMELVEVDLHKVIEAAIETVSAIAEHKSVIIESNLEKGVGSILGDPIRMQQVIWNLLTNAIKFTSKNQKSNQVMVTLTAFEGFAQIHVIDHGMGISAEFLPDVFNRFSQSEESSTRTHGGLGLGLAIVRHLVEMHGGSVKVESEGLDKGATFIVTLPLIKPVADKNGVYEFKSVISSGRPSQKVKPAKLHGLRIMLVEDDDGAREALTEVLDQAGAVVKAAASAKDAVVLQAEFSPDLLVLDIAMPDEDGYSLLRKIRELTPQGAKVAPALALTALARDKDREEAFSAGFQMHLAKPVDIDRLTGALWRLSKMKPNLQFDFSAR